MKKQIKGMIPYLITIDGNNVTTDYGTSADNDIAAIAITQKILMSEVGHFKAERDKITGLSPNEKIGRKFYGSLVNTIREGIKGTSRMLGMLLENYEGYMENVKEIEKLKDEKHEEIKKYLNDNNVTVENGMLSGEEVDKLLKDKFKDIKKDSSPTQSLPFEETRVISLEDFNKESSADENLTNLNENDN